MVHIPEMLINYIILNVNPLKNADMIHLLHILHFSKFQDFNPIRE